MSLQKMRYLLVNESPLGTTDLINASHEKERGLVNDRHQEVFKELDTPVLTCPAGSCGVTAFDCTGNLPENNIEELAIYYTYEMVYNPSMTISDVTAYLEEIMLVDLARKMALTNCPTTGTNPTRRQLASVFVNEDIQRFKFRAVESNPEDYMQMDEFQNSIPCSKAGVEDTCVSMRGGVTVNVGMTEEEVDNGSMRDDIETFVLSAVKKGMIDDTYVAPGKVDKVIFVENLDDVGENQMERTSEDDNDIKSLTKGLVATGGSFLFLIMVLLLCCIGRRRLNNGASVDGDVEDGKVGAIEDKAGETVEADERALATSDSLALKPQNLPTPVVSASSSGSDDLNRTMDTEGSVEKGETNDVAFDHQQSGYTAMDSTDNQVGALESVEVYALQPYNACCAC